MSIAHAALYKFLQQKLRQARLVVPDHVIVAKQVAGDVAQAHAFEFRGGGLHRLSALRAVALEQALSELAGD